MTPAAKTALVAGGLISAGVVAALVLRSRSSSTRALNPFPRTAAIGSASVGAVVPRSSKNPVEQWTDRNLRRRKKHLRMMSAKG